MLSAAVVRSCADENPFLIIAEMNRSVNSLIVIRRMKTRGIGWCEWTEGWKQIFIIVHRLAKWEGLLTIAGKKDQMMRLDQPKR